MQLNIRDMLVQKILDEQENVRDYEEYAKQINDQEVNTTFKNFAKESGLQAEKLQHLLSKYE
ncbi:hypothetical protein OW763_15830 [Clostridium aestuarii]|uniref:Uncharacterized protein n=1 Tax=Clostridium aestuarii TaxID=338193 RepID=A0ABT4D3H0_9CLOT|nr:hypothetical protein [Clostridium aestuarii]MCY6485790.1 hypothetical protein [Clostridium aestuarii]